MKRDAMQKLIEWKNSKLRKPLIVNGAMGVGKTWLMKQFGEDNYSKLNFRMTQSFNKYLFNAV